MLDELDGLVAACSRTRPAGRASRSCWQSCCPPPAGCTSWPTTGRARSPTSACGRLAGRRARIVHAPVGVIGLRGPSGSPWAEPALETAASLLAGNGVLLRRPGAAAAQRVPARGRARRAGGAVRGVRRRPRARSAAAGPARDAAGAQRRAARQGRRRGAAERVHRGPDRDRGRRCGRARRRALRHAGRARRPAICVPTGFDARRRRDAGRGIRDRTGRARGARRARCRSGRRTMRRASASPAGCRRRRRGSAGTAMRRRPSRCGSLGTWPCAGWSRAPRGRRSRRGCRSRPGRRSPSCATGVNRAGGRRCERSCARHDESGESRYPSAPASPLHTPLAWTQGPLVRQYSRAVLRSQ